MNPGPSIDILGISVNSETRLVTLRWTSRAESSYLIEETTNPRNGWVENLSGIEGGTTETTCTISPNQDQGRSQAMFFRVREMTRELIEPTDIDLASTSSSPFKAPPLDSESLAADRTYQEISRKPIDPAPKKTETHKFQSAISLNPIFLGG